MLKRYLSVIVIGLLFWAFLAGCVNKNSDAERIVGTLEYRVTNSSQTVYLNIVF